MSIDHETCRPAPRRPLGASWMLGALTVCLGGCVLTGIVPDEIDVSDESDGGEEEAATGEDGVEDTGYSTGSEGDGDGDPAGDGDGDGDGDPTTGDGDGDGDGDGEVETGDGDGDGDGDRDAPCSDFGPQPVYDGPNQIEVPVGPSVFEGSCGGQAGPEAIFSYVATSEGLVSFELAADFDAVLYLVGEQCVPLDEWLCHTSLVETLMTVDQTVYVFVDSQQADVGGTATLTITGP